MLFHIIFMVFFNFLLQQAIMYSWNRSGLSESKKDKNIF